MSPAPARHRRPHEGQRRPLPQRPTCHLGWHGAPHPRAAPTRPCRAATWLHSWSGIRLPRPRPPWILSAVRYARPPAGPRPHHKGGTIMLTIFGRPHARGGYCDGVSRRDFLTIGGTVVGGALALPNLLAAGASSPHK